MELQLESALTPPMALQLEPELGAARGAAGGAAGGGGVAEGLLMLGLRQRHDRLPLILPRPSPVPEPDCDA